MKVTVSVPGKVFLMGEHAVVYSAPAIIAAINKRLQVTVTPADSFIVTHTFDDSYVSHCVSVVCTHFSCEMPHVRITITSDIPVGYHIGSSAAVAAGVVGALTFYLKKIWNPQLINQLAYECEKKIHGNPSGADPAAVVSGGLIWYRKELEFLRSIWQLPVKIAESCNHFYLLDTGKPVESTGEMVALVRAQHDMHHARFTSLFLENEYETKRIAIAFHDADEKTLLDAIRKGERTLEKMGVVSKKVQKIIREIERAGGAAKILGGGGKKAGVGYLLCYIPPFAVGRIRQTVQPVQLASEGIRLEKGDVHADH